MRNTSYQIDAILRKVPFLVLSSVRLKLFSYTIQREHEHRVLHATGMIVAISGNDVEKGAYSRTVASRSHDSPLLSVFSGVNGVTC